MLCTRCRMGAAFAATAAEARPEDIEAVVQAAQAPPCSGMGGQLRPPARGVAYPPVSVRVEAASIISFVSGPID